MASADSRSPFGVSSASTAAQAQQERTIARSPAIAWAYLRVMEVAMARKSVVSEFRLSAIVIVCVLLFAAAPAQGQEPASGPSQGLADLAAGIVSCAFYPCLGYSHRDVRRLRIGRCGSD